MPHYVLDKAYTVNQAGGVAAHRVVVQGTNAGECKNPAGAGDSSGTILGVTTHAQTEDGRSVAVRKNGIALVEASAAIAVGSAVDVADTAGKVRAVSLEPTEMTNTLGFAETGATAAGDLVEIFLSIHTQVQPQEI